MVSDALSQGSTRLCRGTSNLWFLHCTHHWTNRPFLILQADKQHILAAVISCSPTAQGGAYLQRHLQRELAQQIKQHGGTVQAAIPATLRALNESFRDMHPFNGPVCEGVRLTLAYIDAKTKVAFCLRPF